MNGEKIAQRGYRIMCTCTFRENKHHLRQSLFLPAVRIFCKSSVFGEQRSLDVYPVCPELLGRDLSISEHHLPPQ